MQEKCKKVSLKSANKKCKKSARKVQKSAKKVLLKSANKNPQMQKSPMQKSPTSDVLTDPCSLISSTRIILWPSLVKNFPKWLRGAPTCQNTGEACSLISSTCIKGHNRLM